MSAEFESTQLIERVGRQFENQGMESGTIFSKTILFALLIIQFASLVAIIFDVFAIRQILGFLYLSFVPGYLILKLFKLGKIGFLENALFSIGLSIAFLMFFGLLLNTVYPVLGFSTPLSAISIIISLGTIVLILYLILFNKRNILPTSFTMNFKFFPIVPLMVIIPFLTVFGTELANYFGNTSVLMFLVIVVSLIAIGTFFKQLIPPQIFPLTIFIISFFLLFHISLVSNYLIGADVHTEFYFAQLTSINSIWNKNISSSPINIYDTMLSTTILPTIFSKFLNLDMNWVFKLVYPLIYLTVPLVLYQTYRKMVDPLVAFLSVFLFMLFNTFYLEMLGLVREIIGELFFALLILLIMENKIGTRKKRLLFMAFSIALVVSHYSLAYLLVFFLIAIFLFKRFLKRPDDKFELISGHMIIAYFAVLFLWNLWTVPLLSNPFIDFIKRIYLGIVSLVPSPGVSGLMPIYVSPLHQISQYLFYLLQLFILIGIIGLLAKRKEPLTNREYVSLSIASMIILLMCIFLPSFAAGLQISRFYHLALFFLAPFCIIGSITFFDLMIRLKSKFLSSTKANEKPHNGLKNLHNRAKKFWLFFTTVLLISLFLFQVGFVYEITGDVPTSISLSRNRMSSWTLFMNQPYIDQQQVSSTSWLAHYINNESQVNTDAPSQVQSYSLIPPERINTLSPSMAGIKTGSYYFFGKLNDINPEVGGYDKLYPNTNFSSIFNVADKIYSNLASDVYYYP
jgi:uncharacterized membrane protein